MAGASVIALIAGSPAVAQGQAATLPPAAQANAGATIETLVVTAQRREESIETVGIPIQALKGETLERLRINDPEDLSALAPSFSVSQSYQGVPTYTLRGIGFNTINISATSTVGTYTDEVAYAYPIMNSGPMFDLERVEVLKGPQGTLYGRNTTAGLIDFVTAKPSPMFEARAGVELGNYDTQNFEGALSGPLGDHAQARISFRTEDSGEGWQVSNSRPGDRRGEVHRYGVRWAAAFQPTGNLTIDASYNLWHNGSDTVAAQAIGFTPGTAASPFNAPGLVTYVASHAPTKSSQADWASLAARAADIGTGLGIGGPAKENTDFGGAKLRVNWDLTDNIRLVSLTSYNDLERGSVSDWSGAPYEILVQKTNGRIKSFAEDFHLEGSTEASHWLIGVYYAKDDILDSNRTMLGQNANVGLIRYNGALLLGTPFNANGYTALQMSQAFRTYEDVGNITAKTSSIFGNFDTKLGAAFKLSLGLRYSRDKQDYAGCSRDFNGNMLPNVNVVNRYLYYSVYGVIPAQITQGACNTFNPVTKIFGQVTSSLDENNLAWRVGLDWTPAENLLWYASVSKGAKAGSTPINAANISTQNAPAKQELLTAYETGVKAGLLEHRLQVNASAFYYDYKDKQLSGYFADPIYTALARLVNIPKSAAYGLDGDITWRVAAPLTLIASATWLHTEVKGYSGTNGAGKTADYDGAEFLSSPKFQGGLTALFTQDLSNGLVFQAAFTGRYQTKSHADLEGNPLYEIKAYGVINGSLGIGAADQRWNVSIWGQNLADTYYWNAVSSNANTVVRFPGKPRTYGVALTSKF
jgi:iron complex outermembrane receptor protein